jgi:hypothetical protein
MRLSKATLELEINDPSTLVIDAWDTPATRYPLEKVGRAKITRSQLKKGFLLMEGVRGYAKYYLKKPIPVTSLKIGKETVMVDDPLQWCGMQDLARQCKGKVLIGGLGLGLILHALQDNKDVTEIHVIENNFDVIKLMVDKLPRDKPKWQIIPADVYWYLDHRAKCQKYDTVVMDIWWGRGSIQIGMEMMVATAKTKYALPDAKLMIWGHRDPEINPAVTKEGKGLES